MTARFSRDLADLSWIDVELLKRRGFRRDPEDPSPFERYQAEALVHEHVPASALSGIVSYSDAVVDDIKTLLGDDHEHLRVLAKPTWYF